MAACRYVTILVVTIIQSEYISCSSSLSILTHKCRKHSTTQTPSAPRRAYALQCVHKNSDFPSATTKQMGHYLGRSHVHPKYTTACAAQSSLACPKPPSLLPVEEVETVRKGPCDQLIHLPPKLQGPSNARMGPSCKRCFGFLEQASCLSIHGWMD